MDLKTIKLHRCSLERYHDVLIELKRKISTKAYAYLDKNKFLGHLDTKICKTKIMKIFIRKYSTIYKIKCNADNKIQSFKMWSKPLIKSFISSSGSFLQINLKLKKTQVKIYFIIDMRVSKSFHFIKMT